MWPKTKGVGKQCAHSLMSKSLTSFLILEPAGKPEQQWDTFQIFKCGILKSKTNRYSLSSHANTVGIAIKKKVINESDQSALFREEGAILQQWGTYTESECSSTGVTEPLGSFNYCLLLISGITSNPVTFPVSNKRVGHNSTLFITFFLETESEKVERDEREKEQKTPVALLYHSWRLFPHCRWEQRIWTHILSNSEWYEHTTQLITIWPLVYKRVCLSVCQQIRFGDQQGKGTNPWSYTQTIILFFWNPAI